MSEDRRHIDTMALRSSLAVIERQADALDWAAERPWRTTTHVWGEGELPVVDLHELDARLAREAIRVVAEVPLQTGALDLITGRGRHSVTEPVLTQVARSELGSLARARGWQWRPGRPGRLILITDVARAPRSATGVLGTWFYVGVLTFLALLAWLAPAVGVPIAVAALAWWLLSRR